MKRPLCCVCAAFVVTVFFYLKFCPPPELVRDFPEGERITLLGEVYKKEYQSGYQQETLVLWLRDAQIWYPGMDQDVSRAKGGNVICYMDEEESIALPKAGRDFLF